MEDSVSRWCAGGKKGERERRNALYLSCTFQSTISKLHFDLANLISAHCRNFCISVSTGHGKKKSRCMIDVLWLKNFNNNTHKNRWPSTWLFGLYPTSPLIGKEVPKKLSTCHLDSKLKKKISSLSSVLQDQAIYFHFIGSIMWSRNLHSYCITWPNHVYLCNHFSDPWTQKVSAARSQNNLIKGNPKYELIGEVQILKCCHFGKSLEDNFPLQSRLSYLS